MSQKRVMDDRYFNELIARYECSKLDSIYHAIEKWEDVAAEELMANRPDTTGMSDLQAEWAADHFNDQAFMMDETKQSMLASLGVTIASSVENYFGALCEELGVQVDDRAGWGQKRQRLEAHLGINLRNLDGIDQVTRVRLLGNCFKHNEGKMNQEYVNEFGGNVGDEIDYGAEDWKAIIDTTQRFLLDLVSHT